jgi:predicted GIY-YIG superfamily endonuclease
LQLVYRRVIGERGRALRVERRIKSLSRAAKVELVRSKPTQADLLKRLALDAVRV